MINDSSRIFDFSFLLKSLDFTSAKCFLQHSMHKTIIRDYSYFIFLIVILEIRKICRNIRNNCVIDKRVAQ